MHVTTRLCYHTGSPPRLNSDESRPSKVLMPLDGAPLARARRPADGMRKGYHSRPLTNLELSPLDTCYGTS